MSTPGKTPLRSAAWFGAEGKVGFMSRSWMRNDGLPDDAFRGRPIIGIASSWSELTPCNVHLRGLAEYVKRGVWQAGGVPLEFPTTSLGEPIVRPSSMLLRNLVSIDLEETLRANPLDGVVLLAGCDKTTPAYLMGAASVDLPTILLTGGPMLNGRFRDTTIGSGTAVWRLTEDHRAGRLSTEELAEAEACMSRSNGHCMTMGTASTMSCISEVLGMQLPGGAEIPAVDARRKALAHATGVRAVALVAEELRPSAILTRPAFENAIRINAALGGSTNAVIHLLALARRVGVPLELAEFDGLVREVPTLVDMMPSGRFLMEDFFYAGGLQVVVDELGDLLHRDAPCVSGRTLGEQAAGAQCWNREVIRTRAEPFRPVDSGIAVLYGNLCPDGAVLKQSATSDHFFQHEGTARVFESIEEYTAWADGDAEGVTADDVLVLRNSGPKGYPGMPEIGNLPLPHRLLEAGVADMVRISDARMSGTSYGTVILHVAPEAAVGGPLALVREGDRIRLDVRARTLDMLVPVEEIERRRAEWVEPPPRSDRGWIRIYHEHVLQANEGADLDLLAGGSGHAVPRQAF
jgi:dihydroxy-acid dehydratase